MANNYTKSTILNVRNARLLKITEGNSIGVSYDSEFPGEETPDILWEGSADAYLQIKTTKTVAGGRLEKYQETSILIPDLADVKADCVLEIEQFGEIKDYKITDVTTAKQDIGLPDALRCFSAKV